MNYLGIDYGSSKIGLAKASGELPIATPLGVIKNKSAIFEDLEIIIASEGITEIVVGYPLSLSGEAGPQTKEVDAFIEKLRSLSIPVVKQDERFSTKSAVGGKDDDASAAALILQTYLDSHAKNNQ